MYQSFEELEVWKRAYQLAVLLYGCLENCRDYGLKDQMQRAVVSIASNIAEGSERSAKIFAHFLAIARGSAAELRTQLYIAARIGIIQEQTMRELVDETKQISKMLFALAKSLDTEHRTLKTKN
jgi:four helix bundle protein